jgi:uncharacterized protein with ATP-grasp and redox domains
MAVDDSPLFLSYLGGDSYDTVLVVLDDTGESVFDLALFQEVLRQTGHLNLKLVVNRFPVSNNISVGMVEQLLSDE